jgi:hypothetical protein
MRCYRTFPPVGPYSARPKGSMGVPAWQITTVETISGMSELDKRTTYPQSGRGFIAHQLSYNALPSHLQEVSEPFGESAQQIEKTLPSNPEQTTALRKLLEAKIARCGRFCSRRKINRRRKPPKPVRFPML